MAGHSQKSPSRAHRLHHCPGYLALSERVPDHLRRKRFDAADRGTVAHAVLEHSLYNLRLPSAFLGMSANVSCHGAVEFIAAGNKRPGKFGINNAMIVGVTRAYDYVVNQMTIYKVNPWEVMLEERCNPCPKRDDTSGTADVTLNCAPHLLEVIDYKNGSYFVEHKNNPQLLCYLAGMANKFTEPYEVYRVTVVQPNSPSNDGDIRSFDTTFEELQKFIVNHTNACELSDEASAKFQTDDRREWQAWSNKYLHVGGWCAMCDAEPICTARRSADHNDIALDFELKD